MNIAINDSSDPKRSTTIARTHIAPLLLLPLFQLSFASDSSVTQGFYDDPDTYKHLFYAGADVGEYSLYGYRLDRASVDLVSISYVHELDGDSYVKLVDINVELICMLPSPDYPGIYVNNVNIHFTPNGFQVKNYYPALSSIEYDDDVPETGCSKGTDQT